MLPYERQHRCAAERLGIQLPRARWRSLQKPDDLAREVVNCNAVSDGNLGGDLGVEIAGSLVTMPLRRDQVYAQYHRDTGASPMRARFPDRHS